MNHKISDAKMSTQQQLRVMVDTLVFYQNPDLSWVPCTLTLHHYIKESVHLWAGSSLFRLPSKVSQHFSIFIYLPSFHST
jgi:hypothetical protein